MTKMRIVAFAGPKTCGKDTAAQVLYRLNEQVKGFPDAAPYTFREAKMAEGVKSICNEMFGYTTTQMEDSLLKETPTKEWPHLAPRIPMMDIANYLRDRFGGDVHVRRWHRKANTVNGLHKNVCHVMTDLRFPEELEMLQNESALIIYISRMAAEEALATKRLEQDAMAINVSESHYDLIKNAATVIIPNDGEIHQLHNHVMTAVKNHYGHWATW